MRKEFKYFTTRKTPTKHKDSNAENEGKVAIRYKEHKEQKDRSKSLLISNYFKCKWNKLFNQKTEIGTMDLKKAQSNICFLQETHFTSRQKLNVNG